jgi:hypothetical protein
VLSRQRQKLLRLREAARQRLVDICRQSALKRRRREAQMGVAVDGKHHHAVHLFEQFLDRRRRFHTHLDRALLPLMRLLGAHAVLPVGPEARDAAARLPRFVHRPDALRELRQVRSVHADRAESKCGG